MVRYITLLNEETKAHAFTSIQQYDYVAVIDRLNRVTIVKINKQTFTEEARLTVGIITPLSLQIKDAIPGVTDTQMSADECWFAKDEKNHRLYVVVSCTAATKNVIGVVQLDGMTRELTRIYPLAGHIGTTHLYLGVAAKEEAVYSDTQHSESLVHLLIYKKENEPRVIGDRLIVTDDDRKEFGITTPQLQIAPIKPIIYTPLPDAEEIKIDFSTGLGILKTRE